MIRPSKLNERGPAKEIRKKINELLDYTTSMAIMDSPTVKAKRMARGTVLSAAPAGGDEGQLSSITLFSITEINDRFLTCRRILAGGELVSEVEYEVMRPIATWVVGGLPAIGQYGNLQSSSSQHRTYTIQRSGPGVQTKTFTVAESLFPPYNSYIAGAGLSANYAGVIWAAATELDIDDGTGTTRTMEWIDLNVDARKWTMDLQFVEVCKNNVKEYAMANITNSVP